MDWYYADGQNQNGPYPDEQFRAMIDQGTVAPDTLVWHDGMEEWVALSQVSDIPPPSSPAEPAPVATETSPRLRVATRETTAEVATPGFAGGEETGHCRECNRRLPLHEMVQYGDATICADCKQTFFQKIREGATPNFGGNTPNAQLMEKARANLAGRWGISIGLFLIYLVIVSATGQVPFLNLFLAGPFSVGMALFFLTIARAGEPEIGMLFRGFQSFGTALATYLLTTIFVFLWALLLIIPGIIASLAYSQVYFILAGDPTMGPMEAIRLSKEMMRGKKWKYFYLHCRFIGWALLCVLTLGIGFLWLWPYMTASTAEFYDDLRYGQQV